MSSGNIELRNQLTKLKSWHFRNWCFESVKNSRMILKLTQSWWRYVMLFLIELESSLMRSCSYGFSDICSHWSSKFYIQVLIMRRTYLHATSSVLLWLLSFNCRSSSRLLTLEQANTGPIGEIVVLTSTSLFSISILHKDLTLALNLYLL